MKSANGVLRFLAACGGLALLLSLGACRQRATPESAVPQFDRAQVQALERAAEAGDPIEKYQLGKKFRDGDTVPRDLTNAAVWFRKSAEAGYAKAQYHLGLAYEEGQGLARQPEEAIKWFTRAAEQDNGNAQEKLGFIYWKGETATKNLQEAYRWLTLAAANGEGKAAKGLKKLEALMTPQQVADAKKQAAAFIPKKEYKKSES